MAMANTLTLNKTMLRNSLKTLSLQPENQAHAAELAFKMDGIGRITAAIIRPESLRR
jgi:hypothetical protein